MGVIKLLLAGGPFMFATLAVSIVCVAIFITRMIFLFTKASKGELLRAQVMQFLEERNYRNAIRVVSGNDSPLGKVLSAALVRANRTEKEIRRAVEAAAIEEIPKVRGSTVYLPQMANLATLLGLIGTIHGLIIAFEGAGAESAAVRQEVLSQGIAIAFYNTFFGLVVATMGTVFYLVLLARTNQVLGQVERGAATVIDSLLWTRDQNKKSA
jgi:biopolymer transport protein ExbB